MNKIETIRQQYRPKKIYLLFVGESPPANGTFFYLKDSNLYNAIKKGFEKGLGRIGDDQFLEIFKNIVFC